MSFMNIGYDKFNGGSEKCNRSKCIRRTLVAAFASAMIVAAVVVVAVRITGSSKEDDADEVEFKDLWTQKIKSTSNAVKDACSSTLHPELCVSSISSFEGMASNAGPMDIVTAAVSVGIEAVQKAQAHARSLSRPGLDFRQRGALRDCMEMFDDTLDELHDTLSDLRNTTFLKIPKHAADLETLLSAAITNQYTCLEGFSLCKGNLKQDLKGDMKHVSHLVSNSLAMVVNISDRAKRALEITPESLRDRRRRLLSQDFTSSDEDGFPSWMSAGDRRLLQASANNITINAVVAQDGSGDHTTISAAVNAAPDKSKTRYVIRVKGGVYSENVEVQKNKHNLMFIGDGKDLTVVTGNRNVRDNYTTFHSATVAITGKAFIARDITFQNTAGAAKHQAVALRVGSDLSAFYRCSFKGYQDTLYVHSLRQFYRECDVYGTVDFIFGNAAVVLQNSNLYARKPLENQKILYTAQGRQDPNQNTGISIQNCRVTADSDLAAVNGSFEVYLGRPWKEYSRTVFMQSYLDDLINPAGWLEWNGTFALSTLYYGEYMNRGPGAGTANRVKWPGYRVITSLTEAQQFTVRQFIEGDSWLPSTGVEFASGFT